MPQSPLVSLELQRVSAGLRTAARELGAAGQAVTDAEPGALATARVDAVVETGLRDLAQLLGRLESAAAGCVVALARTDEGGSP